MLKNTVNESETASRFDLMVLNRTSVLGVATHFLTKTK